MKQEPSKKKEDRIARRQFVKSSVFSASLPFLFRTDLLTEAFLPDTNVTNIPSMASDKSLIGGYGQWAASLQPKVPALSFRNSKWTNQASWQKEAISKTTELISSPPKTAAPKVTVERKYVYDGLEIEEITWQLPYGRPTRAVVLKPQGVTKPLPAILGLHDHAGKKYFGYRKIVKTSDDQHPLLKEHQVTDYGGKAWANEIAKKGYVVLVHDTFAFGSRRVFFEDVKGLDWGGVNTAGKSDADPEKAENIETYNSWSSEHEHVMSKSLFSAGTTWPGVFLSEDQTALDILSSRKDVDPKRIGCGGLSGGGLRTVYLAGMDPRIKCAVCVGFMTTWTDLILNKSFNHTWMTYTPLLPKYLDFPEILGLRVPLPTLVQNNNQDELYTLEEMKKADAVLGEVYKKANASDKYAAKFYDGPHKFDEAMQKDAFEWFDKWL
ncbi:alpha/beta hydrolase family protein [Dyadobacter pollutisoli]|uniref:Alpha/beta hydrolase family protein n=1 Tax=Dyadobacter pollutisoli TaxID=2910158 RepID=A0A9E8N8D7_9BACT|nr:alpha/beta hydrolase family protein [Dyadobacter pollutisoli]WAC10416.1 alpha/beta hydrolase family protein [Dyadobacter pollutisoli]